MKSRLTTDIWKCHEFCSSSYHRNCSSVFVSLSSALATVRAATSAAAYVIQKLTGRREDARWMNYFLARHSTSSPMSSIVHILNDAFNGIALIPPELESVLVIRMLNKYCWFKGLFFDFLMDVNQKRLARHVVRNFPDSRSACPFHLLLQRA